jgi:hypothetical protein
VTGSAGESDTKGGVAEEGRSRNGGRDEARDEERDDRDAATPPVPARLRIASRAARASLRVADRASPVGSSEVVSDSRSPPSAIVRRSSRVRWRRFEPMIVEL